MADPVRSVTQSFAILHLLSDSPPLSLAEVSRHIGASPSSCLNILMAMVGANALQRDGQTKRYRLAAGWEGIGALSQDRTAALVERVQPRIEKIAQDYEAAVGFWKIVSRDRVQLIAQAETRGGVRLRLDEGQRQPLGSGAVGRALAAGQSVGAPELQRRFSTVRWQAELSFDEYEVQVERAAMLGYAEDRNLTYRGISSVAVAAVSIAPGCCLSASFSSGSRDDGEIEALAGRLKQLAADLTG